MKDNNMTTKEHILPSFWASYLINMDASGYSDEEIEEIETYLNSKKLYNVVSCDDLGFLHKNDVNNIGCDCSLFVELINE